MNKKELFKICGHISLKSITAYVSARYVTLTIFLFLIMVYIAVHWPNPTNIGGTITTFGFIFVALKFKLDKASYNKDLFDRRYKIFLTIDRILTQWCSEGKSSKALIRKINGSLMRRSYYLFGEETYQFIAEFRHSIIFTGHNEHETDDLKFKEKIKQARIFLISVVDGQKLTTKFPELKITIY